MKTTLYWTGHNGTGYFRNYWPAESLNVEVKDLKELFTSDSDVVIVHNPVHMPVYLHLMKLKTKGVKIVVGIDDDFSALPYGFPAFFQFHPNNDMPMDWNVVGETAKYADRLIVTTQALADRYSGCHDIRIIPNYLPDFYYDVKKKPAKQWGVGWTGNIDQHQGDPDVTNGALRGFPLRLVGCVNEETTASTLKAFGANEVSEAKGWLDLLGEYQEAMASFKVGVVPLRDSKFNKSKSFLKGLEFAALGVPFVATPLTEYSNFPAGLRAYKPKQWTRLVRDLLDSESLWNSVRDRGLEVASHYRLANHISEWDEAWNGW